MQVTLRCVVWGNVSAARNLHRPLGLQRRRREASIVTSAGLLPVWLAGAPANAICGNCIVGFMATTTGRRGRALDGLLLVIFGLLGLLATQFIQRWL